MSRSSGLTLRERLAQDWADRREPQGAPLFCLSYFQRLRGQFSGPDSDLVKVYVHRLVLRVALRTWPLHFLLPPGFAGIGISRHG